MANLQGDTRRQLGEAGLHPRKRFGQNFMVSESAVERIIAVLRRGGSDSVIEIGSGLGTVTEKLISNFKNVYAVEVDRDLSALLKKKFEGTGVTVIEQDILDKDLFRELLGGIEGTYQVFGNLPYNIATRIITDVLTEVTDGTRIVVTVQKEVGERMLASHGVRDYGILTAAIKLFYNARKLDVFEPAVFYPPPKIRSMLIELVRARSNNITGDEKLFFRVIKALFAQRRKKILNTLTGQAPHLEDKNTVADLLKNAGIDPGRRPESLSLPELAAVVGLVGMPASGGEKQGQ